MQKHLKYCICEEKINNKWSGCFSIRISTDCNLERFRIIKSFDTFEKANNFFHFLID
jgi:hypothetical protein